MRPRNQELSEKYKAFRLQPDSLYASRLIQTFFNKFTKKGKKALARGHMFRALVHFRILFRRPKLFYALIRLFQRLRIQFILKQRRQGRKLVNVPFPVRRNKRDVLNLQTIYSAVTNRRERVLSERIQHELSVLAFEPRQSTTMRARNSHLHEVYEARVDMERR
jgi:ribosomal protein S7